MLITVLPNGRRAPTGSRLRAFLLTDNWDDWFTYSTMYVLVVYDAAGQEFLAGGVKVGQFGMKTARTKIAGEAFHGIR